VALENTRAVQNKKRNRERGTSLSAVSAVQNKKTNASCTKQNASTVSAENLKYSSVPKLLLLLSFLFIFDHSSYLKYLFKYIKLYVGFEFLLLIK
jgi:hypothetical protein